LLRIIVRALAQYDALTNALLSQIRFQHAEYVLNMWLREAAVCGILGTRAVAFFDGGRGSQEPSKEPLARFKQAG
jgi:hypothetical protein